MGGKSKQSWGSTTADYCTREKHIASSDFKALLIDVYNRGINTIFCAFDSRKKVCYFSAKGVLELRKGVLLFRK